MNLFIITNDIFLAKGMKSLIVRLRWLRIEKSVQYFSSSIGFKRLIFIDERVVGRLFFKLLPSLSSDDQIIILHSHKWRARQPNSFGHSAIDLNLSIKLFIKALNAALYRSEENTDSIECPIQLNNMEAKVFCYILSGMNIVDIAREMGLSVKSVYGYRRGLSKKWGFKSFSHLHNKFMQGILKESNLLPLVMEKRRCEIAFYKNL